MTATAFHEMANCFELSPEDRRTVFALLSHESSFILNARSQDKKEGTRCYGAIAGSTFQTMNKYIYTRDNNIKDSYHCHSTTVDKCCFVNKDPEGCSKLKDLDEDEKQCCENIALWKKYGDIFVNAEKKCPDLLSKKVFPQKIMTYRSEDNKFKKLQSVEIDIISLTDISFTDLNKIPDENNKSKNEDKIDKAQFLENISDKDTKFTCALTHDPYTCMLYSMYYVKMNAKNFEDRLSETPDPDKYISEKFKSLFQNKKIYEITVVQGTVKKQTTDDTEQISVFDYQTIKKGFYQDGCNKSSCSQVSADCSADSNFSKCFDDHCCHEYEYTIGKEEGQLNIKHVPLFSKKLLRSFAIQTAHNYGDGFNKGVLFKFLQFLKRKIADEKACTNPKESRCNSYRKLLLEGKSLTEDDLFYEFENFITETGNPESKDFAKKVRGNLNYLKNPNNKLRTNVKSYVKNKDGNSLSDAEIITFIKEVDKQCSELLSLGSSQ